MLKNDRVPIDLSTGLYKSFSRYDYTPWHATAEFVDNAIQSYIENKPKLRKIHKNFKLIIEINMSSSLIEIKDNAGGISEKNYARAFRTGIPPENPDGLSEFGMGMKTAGCWFSKSWTVRSKALGEKFSREIKWDLDAIEESQSTSLKATKTRAPKNAHFTQILLKQLNHRPKAKSVMRIKSHLAAMYRVFIKKGDVVIKYNNIALKFEEKSILKAPNIRDVDNDIKNPKKIFWKKSFDFKFKRNCEHEFHTAKGYVCILDPMDGKRAGFGLFRRDRVIKGGDDDAWKPEEIVSYTGSFPSKRLFGEIHFDDDMEVTAAKNGFTWTEDEQHEFLIKFKSILDSDEMPLITQSNRFRKHSENSESKKTQDLATDSAIQKFGKVFKALEGYKAPQFIDIPKQLPKTISEAVIRSRKFKFEDETWKITIRLNRDKDVFGKDWLNYAFNPKTAKNKEIEIEIMMNKGFSSEYFGSSSHEVEGMELLSSYIALAETKARLNGEKNTHVIRYYINRIIDSVPPTID
jgi:hypothetical protein|tara:strand:- start:2723 stop:4282 length:1560 start_codon:yes stop_codon:yes gene_type:complete